MDILLADSNRDLLQCYQKLLTMDGHAVTTAFDGAQVVSLMGTRIFDVAILEEDLPRIELDQLLQALNREKIQVIVLTGGSVTVTALDCGRPFLGWKMDGAIVSTDPTYTWENP